MPAATGPTVRAWTRVAGLLVAVTLGLGAGCGDGDAGGTATGAERTDPTIPPSTADPDDPCLRAQATIGATDPPEDLVGVAADAGRIADQAVASEEPLATALAAVSDAAADLTDAARTGELPAVADAAATLSAAYDELDLVAAEIERADCSSESWGRQVAIAAIDLTGAGG